MYEKYTEIYNNTSVIYKRSFPKILEAPLTFSKFFMDQPHWCIFSF